ncbi:MAG: GtrA family protein [Proteobacteria bacterium]|nr:GtrA family protein [Pseudomonadota bacterium]
MALATPIERMASAPVRVADRARIMPQLSRYSAVSVLALAVDFGVYVGLCRSAVNAPVAGIVGYAAGMLAHYVLSSTFVFDVNHSQKSMQRRFVGFMASGLLGLMLTGAVIAALTEYFAAPAIVAKAVAVVMSFLAVFLLRRWIVFAPPSAKKNSQAGLVYPKSGFGN